jgi:hypothetical protein
VIPARWREAICSECMPSQHQPQNLSEDILTIPNVLTILRLASTPVLGYLVIIDEMPYALALLALSGFTDVLDGWYARKFKSATVFGSIADPAADKALMTVMVGALAWRGLIPCKCSDVSRRSCVGFCYSDCYSFYRLVGYCSAACPAHHRSRRRTDHQRFPDTVSKPARAKDILSVLGPQTAVCQSRAHADFKIQHLLAACPGRWLYPHCILQRKLAAVVE